MFKAHRDEALAGLKNCAVFFSIHIKTKKIKAKDEWARLIYGFYLRTG